LLLGPRSKLACSRPKIGSHLAPTVARHLSEEMPTRPPCTSHAPTIVEHRCHVRLPPGRASTPSKSGCPSSPSPHSLPPLLRARAQTRPPLLASQAVWLPLVKPSYTQPSAAPAPLHPTSPSSIHAAPPPSFVAEQPPPLELCHWCRVARPS